MKEQSFGVEIEFNHISRAKAAKTIADYFGTQAHYAGGAYDTREVQDASGRVWKIMSDASIEGPHNERCELVTPICHWDDIRIVQDLAERLRAAGAVAHESCGVHLHVGRGEHTARTLRNLVNMVNAKEDLLTEALDISAARRERWCRPVDQEFLQRLNQLKPKDDIAFAKLWYNQDDLSELRCRMHNHYDHTRYRLLNLHAVFQKGTIEFRAFNSTLEPNKLKAYIQLCMAISYSALKSTSASPTRPITDNPKYAFRCWLLKLGFIGDEYAVAREELIANLPGNSAWRHGRPAA